MNVLVCVKRVPDVSGEVLLTDDEQAIDARHVGFTMSPHEECAVELATQLASSSGGTVTVLTVGPDDAVEQLRTALAVGCTDGVLVQAPWIAPARSTWPARSPVSSLIAPRTAPGTTWCCWATTPPTPATSRCRCGSHMRWTGR